jgi:hypothetical protein
MLEASDRAIFNVLYQLAHDSGALLDPAAEWEIPLATLRQSFSKYESNSRLRDSLERLRAVRVKAGPAHSGLHAPAGGGGVHRLSVRYRRDPRVRHSGRERLGRSLPINAGAFVLFMFTDMVSPIMLAPMPRRQPPDYHPFYSLKLRHQVQPKARLIVSCGACRRTGSLGPRRATRGPGAGDGRPRTGAGATVRGVRAQSLGASSG